MVAIPMRDQTVKLALTRTLWTSPRHYPGLYVLVDRPAGTIDFLNLIFLAP